MRRKMLTSLPSHCSDKAHIRQTVFLSIFFILQLDQGCYVTRLINLLSDTGKDETEYVDLIDPCIVHSRLISARRATVIQGKMSPRMLNVDLMDPLIVHSWLISARRATGLSLSIFFILQLDQSCYVTRMINLLSDTGKDETEDVDLIDPCIVHSRLISARRATGLCLSIFFIRQLDQSCFVTRMINLLSDTGKDETEDVDLIDPCIVYSWLISARPATGLCLSIFSILQLGHNYYKTNGQLT
ncbi:hypothetical protein J6590_087785 [Homalodisca vitripennis]|nr:hypothetical protein J6590_087785 [Homalodisca vitripennis]